MMKDSSQNTPKKMKFLSTFAHLHVIPKLYKLERTLEPIDIHCMDRNSPVLLLMPSHFPYFHYMFLLYILKCFSCVQVCNTLLDMRFMDTLTITSELATVQRTLVNKTALDEMSLNVNIVKRMSVSLSYLTS